MSQPEQALSTEQVRALAGQSWIASRSLAGNWLVDRLVPGGTYTCESRFLRPDSKLSEGEARLIASAPDIARWGLERDTALTDEREAHAATQAELAEAQEQIEHMLSLKAESDRWSGDTGYRMRGTDTPPYMYSWTHLDELMSHAPDRWIELLGLCASSTASVVLSEHEIAHTIALYRHMLRTLADADATELDRLRAALAEAEDALCQRDEPRLPAMAPLPADLDALLREYRSACVDAAASESDAAYYRRAELEARLRAALAAAQAVQE